MPTVREVGAEHDVARLEQREVDGHVGLGTRVRLDVGVLAAEQLPGPRDGEILDHVDDLAAAVVASTGVPLGVLVGEDRAGGLQDGLGHEVLRGDQLEVPVLALGLVAERLGDLGVCVGEFPEHTQTIPIVAPGVKNARCCWIRSPGDLAASRRSISLSAPPLWGSDWPRRRREG